MPQVETKYFGTMAYAEESIFEFPFGVPGFEEETRFVFIENPEYAPLVFLQSLSKPMLCFLALPIVSIDPEYCLTVSVEDRAALQLRLDHEPTPKDGILVLALVSLHDGFSATANLMAPIVVNIQTRHAVQAIRIDQAYSHQHPVSAGQQCEELC